MSRVALVTGAGRGLGRVIAGDLGRDTRVAVHHRRSTPDDLAENMRGFQADLADPDAPARLVAQVIEAFGRLDIIVNNAALFDGPDLHAVNVVAPAALLEAALPHLRPGAAVVNVSSVNAQLPATSAPDYSASKAALDTWTRWAAKVHGPRGIRVNAVAPGPIAIPEAPRPAALVRAIVGMTALGRLVTPEDVAAAVRFLASDAAGGITGAVLPVSAGYRL